ncbi:hypothetical protein [Limosilactobacillus oris]|uniref:hypothetical protein n=1 Tax=Limosilactobacillus oris TaxID=1632 RepID=UPI000550C31B|nr:hypothetical protein [Limosilactobacillus oris]
MDSLRAAFEAKSEEYNRLTQSYAQSLVKEFGSNKKARGFLREQLAKYSSQETHEFIELMIKVLERIALNQ